MSTPLVIAATSIPRLPRHIKFRFDPTREKWILLAPERVLIPDEIALEILHCVDGALSVGAIAAALAEKFSAPLDVVEGDIIQLLQGLADKGMIVA
jgi:pyrroloquinoline quinone biosynthesis protein D